MVPWLPGIDFRALRQSVLLELRWLYRRFFGQRELTQPQAAARPRRDALARQVEEMRAQLRKNGANV